MKKPFYLGVVGSRSRKSAEDFQLVKAEVMKYLEIHGRNLILVSGGCKEGGDFFAEEIAKKIGIPMLIFHPDKQNRPNTGDYRRDYAIIAFARNGEIAEWSQSLIALVNPDYYPDGKGGTTDTVRKFKKFNPGQECRIL